MKKSVIAIIMMLTIGASLLTGCGKSPKEESGKVESNNEESDAAETPSADSQEKDEANAEKSFYVDDDGYPEKHGTVKLGGVTMEIPGTDEGWIYDSDNSYDGKKDSYSIYNPNGELNVISSYSMGISEDFKPEEITEEYFKDRTNDEVTMETIDIPGADKVVCLRNDWTEGAQVIQYDIYIVKGDVVYEFYPSFDTNYYTADEMNEKLKEYIGYAKFE